MEPLTGSQGRSFWQVAIAVIRETRPAPPIPYDLQRRQLAAQTPPDADADDDYADDGDDAR